MKPSRSSKVALKTNNCVIWSVATALKLSMSYVRNTAHTKRKMERSIMYP